MLNKEIQDKLESLSNLLLRIKKSTLIGITYYKELNEEVETLTKKCKDLLFNEEKILHESKRYSKSLPKK